MRTWTLLLCCVVQFTKMPSINSITHIEGLAFSLIPLMVDNTQFSWYYIVFSVIVGQQHKIQKLFPMKNETRQRNQHKWIWATLHFPDSSGVRIYLCVYDVSFETNIPRKKKRTFMLFHLAMGYTFCLKRWWRWWGCGKWRYLSLCVSVSVYFLFSFSSFQM